MAFQTPAPQDGAAGENALDQASAAAEPLITGPAPILWGGFIAFVVIFLVALVLIMRGRLSRPLRAEKTTQGEPYFQPAGEDAEIAFSDEDPAPEDDSAEKDKRRKKSPFANVFASKKKRARDEPGPEERRKAESDHPQLPDKTIETAAPPDEELSEASRRQAEAEFAEMRRRVEAEADLLRRRAEEDAAQSLHAAKEEYARARQHAEEGERTRKSVEDEMRAEIARLAAEAHDREDREADFERRKQDAALEQRMRSMQEALETQAEGLRAEADALKRDLAAQVETRFAALSETLEARFKSDEPSVDAQKQTREHAAAIDEKIAAYAQGMARQLSEHRETLSRELSEHRKTINADLARLSARIDAVAAAPDSAGSLIAELQALKESLGDQLAGPVSPQVQLSDIVQNALPASAFEIRAALSNNRKADCLIRLANPPGAIAIDAGFPVEAFRQLSAAGDDKAADTARADNAFRRAALRHLVDIAERLIVPGETVGSAMMFLPSEAMLSTLHARFPDIVQDSYRARVWIVSPTSLMATLYTISAVLHEARPEERGGGLADTRYAVAEIERLRRRVGALEAGLGRTGAAAGGAAYAADPAPSAASPWAEPAGAPGKAQASEPRPAAERDAGDDPAAPDSTPDEETGKDTNIVQYPERPPFPLR